MLRAGVLGRMSDAVGFWDRRAFTGYIIPTKLCRNFLNSLEHTGGRYPSIADIPFIYAELRNRSLRDSLRVPSELNGVVVTAVSPLMAGGGLLKVDDVITSIDGKPVGDDFT